VDGLYKRIITRTLLKKGFMSTRLMEYFNKMPRLGTLSTARQDGKLNVANQKIIEELMERLATFITMFTLTFSR
jgi:hypothetical protein